MSLIVPFAAGGLNDATARLWAEKIKTDLHATVFIDNRVGAGGTIGEAVVATEDRRFYHHGAIDPWGIARALMCNPELLVAVPP